MFSWTDVEAAGKPPAQPDPWVSEQVPTPSNVAHYDGAYGIPPEIPQPHSVTFPPAAPPLSVAGDAAAWEPSTTTADPEVSWTGEPTPGPITEPEGGDPSKVLDKILKTADDTATTVSTMSGGETPELVSDYSMLRNFTKVFGWMGSLMNYGGAATPNKTIGSGVKAGAKLALAGTPAGAPVSLALTGADLAIKLAGGTGSVDEAIGEGVKDLSLLPRTWGRGAAEHPESADGPIAEQHGWAPPESLEQVAVPSAAAPTDQVVLPPEANPLSLAPPQDAWTSGWAA